MLFKESESSSAHVSKGNEACAKGQWMQAKQFFRLALKQDPSNTHALNGLGVICLQIDRPLRAIIYLERSHKLQKASKELTEFTQKALIYALNTAAVQLGNKKIWNRVIGLNRRALELQPLQITTLNNLSLAYLRTNNLELALYWSKVAIKLDNENPDVLNTRGTIIQEVGNVEEAKELYLKVLRLDPEHTSAVANIASLAQQTGEISVAEDLYKEHLNRFPNDTRVWVNLAGVLLIQGRMIEGWDAYAKRLENASSIMEIPPDLKIWEGNKHKPDKLIIVHEQGLGDSFQFCRFLAKVPNSIKKIFCGPKKLHGLLIQSGLIKHCMDPSEKGFSWNLKNFSGEDSWIPLMSLAHLLQNSKNFNYQENPYLITRQLYIDNWSVLLTKNRNPIVAIHWQGNPDHEVTLSRGRSFPLKTLEPLLDIKGISWLSLQKGPGSEQVDQRSIRHQLHTAQQAVEECWDFEQTAAILMNCDLVITSDSGLAHLAAGLGRPTWLMLMKIPEWRWGLSGAHTPWYPSMRLFRQQKKGDWNSVIKTQVKPALEAWYQIWESQIG